MGGFSEETPILVVNGATPGKTLCLTGAVHGDELNGVEVVRPEPKPAGGRRSRYAGEQVFGVAVRKNSTRRFVLEFAVDISEVEYARDIQLSDHNGQARSLKDFRGKVVVVFFGYTQCPDVCPTALSGMSAVMEELGPEGDRVQVIFVTVDPERDTQELLAEYVPVFDKRFLGMYGTLEKTAEIAKDFRVFYRKSGDLQGHYTVDHTAGTYVFAPDGRLRLYVKHGEDPQVIAADIKALLAGK